MGWNPCQAVTPAAKLLYQGLHMASELPETELLQTWHVEWATAGIAGYPAVQAAARSRGGMRDVFGTLEDGRNCGDHSNGIQSFPRHVTEPDECATMPSLAQLMAKCPVKL